MHESVIFRGTFAYKQKEDKMVIRDGKAEDYNAVEKIAKQVQELHVEFRPDIYHSVETVIDEITYGEYITSRNIVVAEQKDVIVGFMISYIREITSPMLHKRRVLFIDSIAILDKYRRQGIGSKFLEYAKKYAVENELQAVELQVNARNKGAYESYVKNGFSEKSINMEFLL
jgi:ribosomal protein S18 acetylase RimI-like enzyme